MSARALSLAFPVAAACFAAAESMAQTSSWGEDRLGFRIMVREEALRAGLPAEIADAVTEVESAYRPEAVGPAGEIGLMQVMPPTARLLGFTGTPAELAEPATNIRLGVTYLVQAWHLAGQDLCTALMKYRAGHAETRFSPRSVDYCLRVRAVLLGQGYPVAGDVPAVNLAAAAGPATGRRVAGRRGTGRYNWALADARMRAIAGRITSASLAITQ
ncbi:transglycosylase SLT domain-containing protein [Chelatococcus sp. SYSU_G07232]|uniref:Transglycosylase SLT domain-containing protein n=1 Tax=Chelatococcus albus TaxID=3047466 RepID=A0ABT7AED9_9HYPH|nr:transglycosylase SLT domain-containing protein [Chelatococcus sp. SYSU_G07232]MDJ1157465.1 transglycosylase SLT domain-containing protein [Chelatococcus sp. SYSU_G07232]